MTSPCGAALTVDGADGRAGTGCPEATELPGAHRDDGEGEQSGC
ncbi:hypothetical protein [Amycolatopsis nalaikhensis]|uniref:Uncharacterized protein n=1 Tax=Amycolatopsis nalaikhensis TaxID=715472 RepID=A0ABY8XC99_9PSEU|nr:hypothetical protein [Amycolatopsis sp. 2-2]WIV53346.1 hypothetical protein QP939_31120 [Amycolatopsis sp. 2-2]